MTGAMPPSNNGPEYGGPSIREMNARLRARKLYPLRRFVLYTGGAHLEILRGAPVEEREFLVQGTGVLVTTAMAFVSSALASRLLVSPAPSHLMTFAIALGFASLIYTIDRLLVSGTLRPYRFHPEVLTTLWDPYADARWYTIIGGKVRSSTAWDNVKGFLVVMTKVSVRLLLAGVISYLIADVVVIYAFRPTIDTKVSQLQQVADSAARKSLGDMKDAALKAIQSAEAQDAANATSKDVVLDRGKVGDDKSQVQKYETDISKLTLVIAAETLGNKIPQVVLSDGTRFPADPKGTTGMKGCGSACIVAQGKQMQVQSLLDAANAKQATDEAALQKSTGKLPTPTDIAKNYKKQTDDANTAYNDAIGRLPDPDRPPTLLTERAALHSLEGDSDPLAQTSRRSLKCSGGFSWLCSIRNAVFPNSPLGSFVGSFRAVLFLIDIVPILLKIYYSLRGRRAYDVWVAALEEASVADSINSLDRVLNENGLELEDRAAARRGARRSAGARVVRETVRARSVDEHRRSHWSKRDVLADYEEGSARTSRRHSIFERAGRRLKVKPKRRDILVVDRNSSPWARPDRPSAPQEKRPSVERATEPWSDEPKA